VVRWLAEQGREKPSGAESEVSPGSLYSSGLIAAGGVFGLLAIVLNLLQDEELSNHVPHWLGALLRLPWRDDLFNGFAKRHMPHLSASPEFGVLLFVLLAATLFFSARRKLKQT
jgi:hypothetical protein